MEEGERSNDGKEMFKSLSGKMQQDACTLKLEKKIKTC